MYRLMNRTIVFAGLASLIFASILTKRPFLRPLTAYAGTETTINVPASNTEPTLDVVLATGIMEFAGG